MDIWLNIWIGEGEVYTSSHLTKQGALIGQIVDILISCEAKMVTRKLERCLHENWYIDLESEDLQRCYCVMM